MAFESDDDDDRPRAGKSDPSELGALAAGLPASERRSSAPPGPDTDDAIDAAALAALSKGQKGRTAADADDGRVKLKGAPVGPASVPPPSAAPAQRSSYGWLIGVAIGFAVGVPVGGLLFPHTTVVSVPAPQKSGIAATELQLAAAEARARAADESAAAVRPLPGQRLAEQQAAQQAQAPSAEPVAERPVAEQPPAAEPAAEASASAATAQPSAAPGPPGAALAVKKGGPDVQSREAARAATAALNANPGSLPAVQPGAAQAEAPAAAPQPVVAATGPDGRSVDDLLDQALSSSTAKKEQERAERALAPANTIPQSPSRDDVTRAMTVILPAIRGCAAGQSGLATIGIVVKNDGHVESSSVAGAPFEGERSGRCMEGVVRRAKFPRFQQSSFRIQFPLAIQ